MVVMRNLKSTEKNHAGTLCVQSAVTGVRGRSPLKMRSQAEHGNENFSDFMECALFALHITNH